MSEDSQLAGVTREELATVCEARYDAQLSGKQAAQGPDVRAAIRCALEALRALPVLRSQTLTRVTLHVPADVLRGLKEGSLKRFGSVIKDASSGKIVSHLKEIRPANLAKVGKAGFALCVAALSVAEQVLLNEKLAEMGDLLKAVDAKLDAQNQGLLRSAFDRASTLAHLTDPANKGQRIHLIQQDLAVAAGVYVELYENEWKSIQQELAAFRSATFYNDDSLGKLRDHAAALVKNLEVVGAARLFHAQLNDSLGEPEAAAIESAKITQFLAHETGRFLATFGPDSELRNASLYRRPRYLYGNERANDHQITVRALNEQCNGLDEILSRHLLLEATASRVALPPAVATDPPPPAKPSVWQSIKRRLLPPS